MSWLLYWHWFAFGLILVIAESLGAAGFLLGLGMAAMTTGVISVLFAITWQWQLVWFSIFCIVFSIIWWYWLKQRTAAKPTLINKPLETLMGRTFTLTEAIEDGHGKIRVNDSNWQVSGPELPAGTKVKVVAIENGSIPVVEPVHKSE
ncbi:NfeD family protein [Legionella dresdenensis]|uniref:NfeD family protein n=1 Tax=Legionella dresdenensis TaxID=450200 RepID=A0ABV8CGX0_9GAMM